MIALSNVKVITVVPKAMFTGFKILLNIQKIKKKANKASKIFEKTLRKEGIPPEIATELAGIYRKSVPVPDGLPGKLFS